MKVLRGLYIHRKKVESGTSPSGFESARDCLLFLEHRGEIRFGVESYGLNMHGCALSGDAVEEGGKLWLNYGDSCRIELEITRESILLKQDVPQGCTDDACGASVSVVGAIFPRKGKKRVPKNLIQLCGALHNTLH